LRFGRGRSSPGGCRALQGQPHLPSSVRIGPGKSRSAIAYFFDIQRAGDAVRVLAPMTVAAPFCTGVGYGLGGLCGKHDLLKEIYTFEKPKNEEAEEKQIS